MNARKDRSAVAREAHRGTQSKSKLSLYPLNLETALGAALKTGGPPPEQAKKKKPTIKPR
jgi:hypothetical protein